MSYSLRYLLHDLHVQKTKKLQRKPNPKARVSD